MDFKDKFIKYHPDITFEIFQLIWDKLKSISLTANDAIKEMYQKFSNKYNFLETGFNDEEFGVYDKDAHDEDYTEITVEEFLGYNPFTKPTKIDWSKASDEELLNEARLRYPINCTIKPIRGLKVELTITDNNFTIHTSCCKKGITVSTNNGNGTFVKNGCSIFIDGKWAEIISLPEYKPIDKPIESKEKYPEYYEFIGERAAFTGTGFTKGKIYKINNPTNLEAKWNFIDDKGKVNGFSGYNYKYFKPSTKEAFNLQNQLQQILPNGHVDKIVEEIDLTGRYLKALIDSPQSTSYKKDDFVKIITKMSNDRYKIGDDKINSWLYSTNNGTQHHWELMPIGFEPPKSTEFKVGDWIITKDYCKKYDGKPLHLAKIDTQGYCYFDNTDDKRDNCHLKMIIRLATPEEIKSAQTKQSVQSTPLILDCPFNEGDLVSCHIHNIYIEGKIHFEYNKIFICQNSKDGLACRDKLGYNYSWMIYTKGSSLTFANQLISNNIKNLQLLNELKSSDSLDDEYNEIFSGEGILEQMIKSKPVTIKGKSIKPKPIEHTWVCGKPIKTETPKIELLKTTKI